MRKEAHNRVRPWVLALLVATAATDLHAHEVRPAYLALKQVAPDTYDLLWKVPARGANERLALHVRLPGDCKIVVASTAAFTGSAYIERSRIARPGGLTGSEISIEGLSTTLTDVLARVESTDGGTQVTRLTPDKPSFVVEAAPRALEVARAYLVLGVEHILLGIDHLLFVLTLLLITQGTWLLLKTVSAFTAAHSLTLALAALGFVHVPPAPVEAVIALSIVFVAAEIVHAREGRKGITARQPWIVAFTFGLLHGFGFAGALSEVGLPAAHIPLALLFFNVGVELGQLLFIAATLSLIALAARLWSAPRQRRFSLQAQETDVSCYSSVAEIHSGAGAPHSKTRSSWVRLIVPYAIGSVAMFWVIQRVAAF